MCKEKKEKIQKKNNRKTMSWMEMYFKEEIIREIIASVFQEYNISSITFIPRIIDAFKSKLYRMCSKLSAAANCGKKRMKLLEQKWKSGKFSVWQFKVYYEELQTFELQQDNLKIREGKRKREQDVKELAAKKAKTEQKLDKTLRNLEKQKKRFKGLVQEIMKGKRVRGPSKAKTFSEFSRKHKKRIYDRLPVNSVILRYI